MLAALPTLVAILRQRCPRCRDGRVFNERGRMHPACPVCQLKFEREQGYFLGAMYISYGLACAVLISATLIAHVLLPEADLMWISLAVSILFVPLAPTVFRYSRVLWLHFDVWSWP